MRFPIASPFLNRVDRLKPHLVKGQQSFDQRQVFDFWNNLSSQQKEEMLTISDEKVVKDLADSLNAFTFVNGIETGCEIESPVLKMTMPANPGTQLLLMDLNKVTNFTKSPCLAALAEIYSIILADTQLARSQGSKPQTSKNDNEISSNNAIENVIGNMSLLKNRRGIVKVKLAKIAGVLYVFNSIIKFFCFGSKILVNEKSPAEIFNIFRRQFTTMLENYQQQQEGEAGKNNEFQDENAIVIQSGIAGEKLQSGKKTLERNSQDQQRLKPHEVKIFASLLSLTFLFENRILNAFVNWNFSNYTQLHWPSNHGYLVTPNCLVHQRAFEGPFANSGCWRADRNQVFERYRGIYYGNLAFSINGTEWEEQDYADDDGSDTSALERTKEQNSTIGANLRKGTPVLEEILGKPFPQLVEHQAYLGNRNNNYQHPGFYPNYLRDVQWINCQVFSQHVPPPNHKYVRRNGNLHKEKHSQYRYSNHYQGDRGYQSSSNPFNKLMESLIPIPTNVKVPVQDAQFQRKQEEPISVKEVQPLDLLLQNGKSNYQGHSVDQKPFKNKNFAAPLKEKEQRLEPEDHFELIHSTLSANVKMMKKKEKNQ